MTIPLGHLIDQEFVCMACLTDADHREGGITTGGHSALDERVGSGRECSRCEARMPYLAVVRLVPDGCSSIHAPVEWYRPGRRMVWLEREEKTLIDKDALVYVTIGTHREVGLRVTPSGKLRVWVHDLHGDGDGEHPTAQWEFDPHG